MVSISNLVSTQTTLLVLLLVGFLLGKTKVISPTFRRSLTDLVINVVLPCSIVKSFLVKFEMEIMRNCMTILIASVVIQGLSILLGNLLYARAKPGRKESLIYGVQISNAGFLGNPIVEGLYGERGLLYASVYLIPLRILMWSFGLVCYSGAKGKGVLRKVLTHPCILGTLLGIVLMVFQVELPGVVLEPLKLIGNCNTGLSMLVVGSVLADVRPRELLSRDAIVYCAVRLALIPLLVMGVCMLLRVDKLVMQCSVVLAGMPAPMSLAILANQYGKDEKFAVSLIFLSTLGSMLTIPLFSLLLMRV